MIDWKTKLYESYVSTRQAATVATDDSGALMLSRYPQLTNMIKRCVPNDRSIQIGDLGCGHGTLVFCLKELGYQNVEGIDVSSEQVKLAHQLGVAEVRQGDLIGFMQESKKTYDVLFLMDVLEHLDKQSVVDLLELVRQSLISGGRAIIHVPNGEGLFGMRIRYGDFTHENCFTPQSIQQVLSACGFQSVTVFEDVPVIHGPKSFLRSIIWHTLTARDRLLLMAETGARGHILSQNMLVVAEA